MSGEIDLHNDLFIQDMVDMTYRDFVKTTALWERDMLVVRLYENLIASHRERVSLNNIKAEVVMCKKKLAAANDAIGHLEKMARKQIKEGRS